MVSGAKKRELFFGLPYRQGDGPDPGPGAIEGVPHNPVHNWTGDPSQPNGEDMGNFYSAGHDPIFFAHHGNIDRMWYIWRTRLRDGSNADITEPDWLDAAFLFYDEDARPVRCRVRDAIDAAALRYTYQDVALPWLDARPAKEDGSPAAAASTLPATLGKTVRVTVTRPKVSRSSEEKEREEEVLVVDGIEVPDRSRYVKFDVVVNGKEGGGGCAAAQCAGSVALTPHFVRADDRAVRTVARFGITDLLDEIGADGDGNIVVSLVPKAGCGTVTVGGIGIEYVK